MRIGINLLYLIPGLVGGTETYARELISSMMNQISKGDQLIAFCSRETGKTLSDASQLTIITLPVNSINRIGRVLVEQVLLPIHCYKYKIDLLLSLGYSQPLLLPCKSIVTIPDLNWYYHPEDFNIVTRIFLKYLSTISAYRSNAIIAISQSTKDSVMSIMKIKPVKIHVIYLGASFSRVASADNGKVVRSKYSLPKHFILTVLSHYPHKNLETLIQAFLQIQNRWKELHLVIGGTGTGENRILRKKSISKLQNKYIHVLPYVSEDDLASIYQLADVFVFPSAYEGFGLPVLEAMSQNTPVISSNAFSLKEVVGKGGILVDPYDKEGYVLGITELLTNKNMRAKYIKAGLEQVNKFSWDKCSYHTLKLVRTVYETK